MKSLFKTAPKAFGLAILIAVIISCGSLQDKFGRLPGGSTRLGFSIPQGPTTSAILTQGMMIYVFSADPGGYSTTLKLSNESAAAGKILEIPNGAYKVFALGWNGVNELLSGSGGLRCGWGNAGAPIALTGQAVNVQLAMSNEACDFGNAAGNILYPANIASTPMSNAGTPGGLKVFSMKFCGGVGVSGSYPSAVNCAPASSIYSNMFVRVALVGYAKSGGALAELPGNESILAPCAVASGGTISLAHVPPGNPAPGTPGIFFQRIYIYNAADSTCSGSPIKVLDYKEGITRSSLSDFPTISYGPGSGNATILVNAGG